MSLMQKGNKFVHYQDKENTILYIEVREPETQEDAKFLLDTARQFLDRCENEWNKKVKP